MKAVIKPRIEADRPKLETLIPLATPFVVFCDPASACNFACRFCPTGHPDLIKDRFNGVMKFEVFQKVIDDLAEFDTPIKVLRMYKDGEPFLNKRLADMVRYAKASPHVEKIDTTTNGSLIDPERIGPVLEAGIDRINISVDGMVDEARNKVTGVKFDFTRMVENVKWVYANKGACEIVIKTISEILDPWQKKQFFETFGNYCDRIFIENFSPCWPDFDGEEKTGWKITKGLYGQPINKDALTCPYIFYGYSVNADGLVSACFIDWGRKLIIGDVREQSMKTIWNSDLMNALRLQHLRGERKQNPVCGKCGQLTNCQPDNIDPYREMLLEKFEKVIGG
jgi:radical SAM protein with 4Fe4S-binding SPASM domain